MFTTTNYKYGKIVSLFVLMAVFLFANMKPSYAASHFSDQQAMSYFHEKIDELRTQIKANINDDAKTSKVLHKFFKENTRYKVVARWTLGRTLYNKYRQERKLLNQYYEAVLSSTVKAIVPNVEKLLTVKLNTSPVVKHQGSKMVITSNAKIKYKGENKEVHIEWIIVEKKNKLWLNDFIIQGVSVNKALYSLIQSLIEQDQDKSLESLINKVKHYNLKKKSA